MLPAIPRRLALGGTLALPFVRAARAQQTFEFVAGSLGGGWYTMAAGVAALVKDDNPEIQIRVVPGEYTERRGGERRTAAPSGPAVDRGHPQPRATYRQYNRR